MAIESIRITAENFSRYGSVVTAPSANPTSEAADYKFWSDLADFHINGETEIGICTVYRQPATTLTGMERHSDTPEILIPIDAPFVVPLLLPEDAPDAIKAFRVEPGEVVIIAAGVWHGACLPVSVPESSCFVIFKRGTPHTDVAKQSFDPVEIQVEQFPR